MTENSGTVRPKYPHDDAWEYPIFYRAYKEKYSPVHINVTNQTKNIPVKKNDICCIVTTIIADTIIIYNEKDFYKTISIGQLNFYEKTP